MKAQAVQTMESANQPAADLEEVFREHHAMVFRAAYRVTGNADDAEDVLQTVFLRLVKRDSGAEPVDNMASFLHRAAVNAALDLLRARQNIRSVPLDDMEPVLAESPHRGPDRLRNSGEIRDWLRGALARLNPADRADVRPAVLRRKGQPRNRAIAGHHAGHGGGDAIAHARPSA